MVMAIGHSYEEEQQAIIDKLQAENNELRRQLAIRDDLSCQTCRGAGTVLIAPDDGMDCPECVEAEEKIKAEGIAKFWSDIQSAMSNNQMENWNYLTEADFDEMVSLYVGTLQGNKS